MHINGIIVDLDLFQEICKEHGISDFEEGREIMYQFDSMVSKFIEQAIETYKDNKALAERDMILK